MRLTFRQRVGLSMPALVLRLLLAIVFLWAGLGKVTQTMTVSGERAATLANLGIISPAIGGNGPAAPASAPPREEPEALEPAPDPERAPADENAPPTPDNSARRDGSTGAMVLLAAWRQDAPADPPADGDADGAGVDAPSRALQPQPTYTAADFPGDVEVRRVWGLALTVHAAAHPSPGDDGATPVAIWPAPLGSGPWPKILAIAVAATELGAGVLLLMGLLTRLAALGVMGVMLGAMWLTEIGPAIQSGDTVLGFLPDRPAFSPDAWRTLLFQFSLFMAGLALFFAGPGRPSVDHALFGRRAVEDHDGL